MTRNLEITYKPMFDAWLVNTPKRLAHFFTQGYAEAKLKPKRESGYYKSVRHARAIFKGPFEGKSDAFVKQYLFNSEKMLNYVYANRMGNGDEASGDGYRNRGGCIFQITGHDNLIALSYGTGIDFLDNPDLLTNEDYSMIAALWFWTTNNLNKYADADDLDAISDIINIGRRTKVYGDANGFADRKEALVLMKKHFKCN